MKKKFSRLLALIVVLTAVPAAAQPQTFRTTAGAEQVATFFADHSLGEVEGTLQPIAGALTFDPAAPTAGLAGRFVVAAETFDSGLGMRDRDMRENYLEVEQFPEIVFEMDAVRPTLLGSSTPGDTLRLAATGRLTLHGVTRPQTVRATLIPTAGGYRVRATFALKLSDHGIPPPRRFLLKVGDDVRMAILLTLRRSE